MVWVNHGCPSNEIVRGNKMIKKFANDLRKEFKGYNAQSLVKDLMAGVTVTAVALPLALAFGISCGADAAAGLVTAIIGGLVMALLSGASFQISGPTGAMTAVLVTVVAKYSLQGMFITCFLAGILLLICSIFKLGRLVDYIPIPVITGFTSGIALVIALGQIDNFCGTKSVGESLIQKISSYFTNGFHVDLASLLVGLGVIAIMTFWPQKWNQKVPSSLIGIIAATIVVAVFKLDIPTVGAIPKSILLNNRLHLNAINLQELPNYISPAISVAILGMIESLLCASSASRMKKESYDADRELFSQAVGNIILPFFGGVPATAAIARTSVAIKSGCQTRLTGVFHSLVLLLCVFVISPVFQDLPLSGLAGVLIVTAYRMNDWAHIRRYFSKKMTGPILKYLVTMVATVVFDLTLAILMGIAVTLLIFIANVSRLEVEASKVENKKLHALDTDVESSCKGTVVVYIAGPMFFMNSQKLLQKLKAIKGYQTVILSIRGVPFMDTSAISALADYFELCEQNGVHLYICGGQNKVLNHLKTCDLYDKIGDDSFYFSVDRALMEFCA